MKTCDMPVSNEAKRCGKLASVALVWDSGEVPGKPDVHACAEHLTAVSGVLAFNEKRPRTVRQLDLPSDADVLRWMLSGGK